MKSFETILRVLWKKLFFWILLLDCLLKVFSLIGKMCFIVVFNWKSSINFHFHAFLIIFVLLIVILKSFHSFYIALPVYLYFSYYFSLYFAIWAALVSISWIFFSFPNNLELYWNFDFLHLIVILSKPPFYNVYQLYIFSLFSLFKWPSFCIIFLSY